MRAARQNVLSIVNPKLTDAGKPLLDAAKAKMLAARSKRVRPHLVAVEPVPQEPPLEELALLLAPMRPVPPMGTRRTGCPLSGCCVSAASFMLWRISKRLAGSPSN